MAVFYWVYIGNRFIPSKRPRLAACDQITGCIPIAEIPPPRTVDSLKECIARVEGIPNFTRCDLFTHSSSHINDESLPFHLGNFPGSASDKPVSLKFFVDENTKFNKEIRAKQDCSKSNETYLWNRRLRAPSTDSSLINSSFLDVRKGDILQTDGVPKSEIFTTGGGGKQQGFSWRNSHWNFNRKVCNATAQGLSGRQQKWR